MKSDIQLQGLISELKRVAGSQKAPVWSRVAADLEKPTRQRRIVNLSRINLNSKENDTVIVPGKVLGTGELDHRVTVAAFNFSKSAVEKLARSKSTMYTIYDYMKKNPKGQKTRIIG